MQEKAIAPIAFRPIAAKHTCRIICYVTASGVVIGAIELFAATQMSGNVAAHAFIPLHLRSDLAYIAR